MKSAICLCDHGINIKFCKKCLEKEAERNKPSINDRILNILNDGQWHTQKDIASKAGLLNLEGYVDVGRDIRNMRMEQFGSHPIDERPTAENSQIHEYRLLVEASDIAEFWKRRDERIAKLAPNAKFVKENDELKSQIALLEKELSSARDEIDFMKSYIGELEKCKNA